MEQQLFTWEQWDIIDTAHFQFYDCVLKVDIGNFKARQCFSVMEINYGKGELIIWEGEDEHTFKLKLQIV